MNDSAQNPGTDFMLQARERKRTEEGFIMIQKSVRSVFFIFFAAALILGTAFSFFPANAGADSMLDTGPVVNAKMKSLAAGEKTDAWAETGDIRAVCMADSLPDPFVPSEANTVSVSGSGDPVYIFTDGRENADTVYFYTESGRITMNPDSSFMFSGNTALTDISGLANWDSSKVISLTGAFSGDRQLSDLTPLSGWNTKSLMNAGMMFLQDSAIEDISALAGWDTSGVTDMYALFCGASGIKDSLALRNWDTSSVTDMSFMFSGCTSMLFADVSNWNTGKVTTMANMFQVGDSWKANGRLTEIIGLGDLDVSNVTDMTCMFYGAAQMTTYDIARWNVSRVESMNHMFCDNRRLRSLDLSDWDVSSLRTIYCMFDDNVELRTIGDVSHWNTASLIDAGGWLNEANSFTGDNTGTLDLSGWDTRRLKSAGEMFLSTKIHTIDLSGWTFESITNDLWEGAGKGIFYETGNGSEDMKGLGSMFKNSNKLTTVYISQAGLESYNKAVENGVNTLQMWTNAKTNGFTVK